MKKIIAPLILALLPLAPIAQAIEYREELAPPNVAFFIELQGTRTDFSRLGGDNKEGLRIRLGLDFKDVTVGGWMLRTEAGLNQFGTTRQSSSFTEDIFPGVNTLTTDTTQQLRLNGIEAGLRLYDNRLFYVRGGAFVYSLRDRLEETTTERDPIGTVVSGPTPRTPQEETISGIGPYAGVGLEIPLVESVKVVAEVNAYRVNSESLSNLSIGFQFSF